MKNIPTVLRRKTKSANFYQFCQVGPVPAGGPRRRLRRPRRDAGVDPAAALRTPVNKIEYFPPNEPGLVLGCIDADFCK